ncbi:hypothetical protein BZG77_14190 [Salinivibrio sp. IB643]|nr:hypothetical protein BZG77_14190 [Salinivibrio sp. IB643]
MSREALENRDEIIDELKEGLSKNKYCKEIFSYHIFNKTIDYYLEEQDFHEFLVFFISSLSLAIKTYVEILKFLPSHYKEDHEAIAAHFYETVSDPVALSHFNEEYMRQGIKLIDNVL